MSITLSPAAFSEEKFQLYKWYQIVVHDDEENEVTQTGFQKILVISPLSSSINRPGFGPYGTFHQEYRCDGTLFAVGVLDILPSGLSSKLEAFKFAPLDESAYQQRSRISVSEPSELKQLFPPRPSINDLRRVAIHISRHNATVRLQDLTPEGQKILGNILLDLSDHIPLQVLNQLVISV